MNFYNTAFQTEAMTLFQDSNCFDSTLYPEEKELIRICTPEY